MAIVAIPGHAPPAHLLSARMARLRDPVIPHPKAPSVALHMSAAPLALTAAVALPTLVVAVGDTHIVRLQSTDLENPGCAYSPGGFLCYRTCPSAQCLFRIRDLPLTTLSAGPC